MAANPEVVRALLAKAERGDPMSFEEMAEFNTLRAREMARAEARRNPQREPDLLEDAPDGR
ncbi:hypothetical protein LJR143_002208 [Pseudoxanthomonas sp. LjRoot143]|uniref:hypothetical protein n=1 Tax=Pseudoxanthomonas sp. LjRoot143 TaxID=3342266 RepID=UPI003ECFA379